VKLNGEALSAAGWQLTQGHQNFIQSQSLYPQRPWPKPDNLGKIAWPVRVQSAASQLPPNSLMHTWQWQTWNDLPYLTCSLLEPWQHGFLTRQFAPRSVFELTPMLAPSAPAYRAQQVHGNIVLLASEIPVPPSDQGTNEQPSPTWPDGDGVVSESGQQAMWVCTADCTPVLIGDGRTGQVAAVHAGWRGTAQKIVPVAIGRLQAQGSQLADLRVAMGPAIAGEVYQVAEAVALETVATVSAHLDPSLDPALLLAHWQAQDGPPILPDPEPGKVRLDVRRVNALQLEQLGLSAEQVAIAPDCTFQDPTHFFSYRRDNLKKVQWSGIVSR
jgi:polyphenol oxidase